DLAEIRLGNAVRYGATVFNDEGEVAGAIVMMLKGENSSKVISRVKARIKEIEKTLPVGVMIEPFLDRTKMVNNAISTVKHNLLEGALIVIFVLVIFLGNIRAGLIVASVIPLAMLFAIIMMNLFGVSGNLMSLGALDFGLLVDGAVIIVEAVMHKLVHGKMLSSFQEISQSQMDDEVGSSAKKMMNSAAFGQIIILIVYLPILSLQGIEGKMFKPMAETVSFAIIGAFFLSITYVPMMSSLMLSKKLSHRKNFSDKIMRLIHRYYEPVLKRALRIPIVVIALAFVFFAGSVFILSSLGGEFIPQLEEGDFAVDTRLLTGSSLTNTIHTTEKSSRVLLNKFPEVLKVVTKIGSGEIPTDPMPLEASDMMVILKPKEEWKSASSFPELANKMSDALQEVPGIATGFQFPVQMRFNELMTGARQDVVCKIFGDDLDSLALYGDQLGKIIQTVKGAKDIYTETITGIPQIVITYNRDEIARYGANISDINNSIQSSYAGAVAGLVFEGDKRYDLVIRMNAEQKKDVNEIGNLLVGLPNGQQVPLNSLAHIEIKDGPYQIQREDARRRITVGFNVRGRDVQSIVNDLKDKAATQIKLPAGYYMTYGGQYENLQNATERLSIVLPIALLLIFLMLFFAFGKFKYCLLIFSAIPLSAIGGILAIWLRGMPFSISAGVGFIALFGVSVLNGIVLISEMNRLKQDGLTDIKQIIIKATRIRLRPVSMTAAVASLGFLPMALSNGAGAEVQRPLATVVIGGLVTATLLTLLVLPCLYLLFERSSAMKKRTTAIISVILLLFAPSLIKSQSVRTISLNEAIQLAQQQNLQIKLNQLQEKYFEELRGSATDIPKTHLNAELGAINSTNFDNRFSLLQNFSLPGLYKRQHDVFEQEFQSAKLGTSLKRSEIVRLVKRAYLQLQYIIAKRTLLEKTDSIFSNYLKLARLRFEKGESNILEKTTLENQVQQLHLQIQMLESDKQVAIIQLNVLINMPGLFEPSDTLSYLPVLFDSVSLQRHPYLNYYKQQELIASSLTKLEKAKLQPDLMIGYNNQSIVGWQFNKDRTESYYGGDKRFSTIQIGVAVPVFTKAQKARIRAANLKESIAEASTSVALLDLKLVLEQNWNEYLKYQQAIEYYKRNALAQSDIIIHVANLNYKNGEINYIEWGTLLGNAIGLKSQYVDALKEFNLHKIELEYLLQSNQN
ncbi:MAG TPA: CusA/CzcA family heavy metal efflux RND transporter, partial [Puia sp.]|nr:CusA/CzcA family heavy metal efflux RND transporter [Puia sp.]